MKRIGFVLLALALFATPAMAVDFFYEDFSAGIPGDWTNMNNGGSCVWTYPGTGSGAVTYFGDGNFAEANSDACGSGTTMNTSLITPAIDCSGYINVQLIFNHYFYYLSSDTATVEYSLDGGTTWTQIAQWTASVNAVETLDLAAASGQASVMLRFTYVAPGWNWYWGIDDVTLSGIPNVPGIYLSGPDAGQGDAGTDVVYGMTVYNNTGSKATVAVGCTGTWPCDGPATLDVPNATAVAFDINVSIPAGTPPAESAANNVAVSAGAYNDDMDLETTSLGSWISCVLSQASVYPNVYWGMGFDGTNLWVSYTGDLLNHAFDPATCTATGATCNPAACSAGASWYADMAYNSQSGEMCQLAVSGNNNIFCWNPTTCACGTTYANLATSERGLAYRAGTNSFFYGGWNTYTLTEMNADGGAILNTLYIGLSIAGLAYDPATDLLYVATNDTGDEVYVYDVSATPWVQVGFVFNAPSAGDYNLAGADYVSFGKANYWAVLDMNTDTVWYGARLAAAGDDDDDDDDNNDDNDDNDDNDTTPGDDDDDDTTPGDDDDNDDNDDNDVNPDDDDVTDDDVTDDDAADDDDTGGGGDDDDDDDDCGC